ncbi:MAG TPA: ATP-binding protein [candidate division Zixibacteria bacterium]|nr:ATP-binding protein [candidate division Zixibacteria bacterium]
MTAFAPSVVESVEGWQPSKIESLADTGLGFGLLSDMVLKTMYFRGQITGFELADELMLPFSSVIHSVMDFLKREQMVEVKGASSLQAGTFLYVITTKGSNRASEQLDRVGYIGPAPVTWDDYTDSVRAQGSRTLRVDASMVKQALSHLVLDHDIFKRIGPAINSGRSIFMYGPPGNGKTTIAESIGRMVLGNEMYVPYCVEVDGQIIKVYDEINHVKVSNGAEQSGNGSRDSNLLDRRWIKIQRPVIIVGGELTMDGLDLVYDPNNRYYEAPYQMKANGGMFLVDDFGRQQIRPRDLLNRWIVPMEKMVDYLALRTGRKIEIPFNVLLVFCTNLPPGDLVDEAFLRRIRHKIHISSPSFESYRKIFRMVCQNNMIPQDDQALRYLIEQYYVKPKRKLRANHPRDLIDQVMDISSYEGVHPRLSKSVLDQAAESYFVDV